MADRNGPYYVPYLVAFAVAGLSGAGLVALGLLTLGSLAWVLFYEKRFR